jgi:hypothetical protein
MIDDAFAGTGQGMCANGVWLDGYNSVDPLYLNKGYGGIPKYTDVNEFKRRPVLLRIAFTLVDPAVNPQRRSLNLPDGVTPDPAIVSQSFSFSIPIGSILR